MLLCDDLRGSPKPAEEILRYDLRRRGINWLLRLQRSAALSVDRHLRVLCRARSYRSCNRCKRPGSTSLVERWGDCDGPRHLGDALPGDAGAAPASARRVSLADSSGVALRSRPRVRGRALCCEPPENGSG